MSKKTKKTEHREIALSPTDTVWESSAGESTPHSNYILTAEVYFEDIPPSSQQLVPSPSQKSTK